jgi:photosystem II stability/assembly factor-like uncharacterized protein
MADSLRAVRMTPGGVRGFAAGDRGLLLRTDDGGATWRLQTCGSRGVAYPFTGLATDSTGELGWAVTKSGAVCVTTDSGAIWSDTNAR